MEIYIDDIPMYIITCDKDGKILYLNKHILEDIKFSDLRDYKNVKEFIKDGMNILEMDIKKNFIINTSNNILDITVHTKKIENNILLFINSNYKCYEIKNTFIANITHEIRTPLNAIIGITTLMQDTNLDEDQTAYIDMLVESNGNLMNIIDNILDYSNLESKKLKLYPESFYLKDCIDEIHSVLAEQAFNKTVNMVYEIVDKNIELNNANQYLDSSEFIITDKLRLQQIFINLYSNSLKYINPKAIINTKIYIKDFKAFPYKPDLFKNFLNEDNLCYLHVEINDNCMYDTNMFNHYHQLFNDFNTSINEGLGLGVLIAKNLCKLMNGDIELNNEKGIISFHLLVEKSYKIDDKSNFDLLKGKKVLLVDDSLINRITLSETLSKIGMIPFSVASSEEALMYVKNNIEFDIGLLDIYLPKYNGVNLAKNIKLIKPNLPLIALSSVGDNIGNTMNNFKQILIKPINPIKLYNIIASILIKGINEAENALHKISILIDEDDSFNRKILRGQLNKLGYTNITEVENGKECIEILKIKMFDLVFIDIKTPFLSGYDVIDYINKNINPKPFCVYLSGMKIKENYHSLFNCILLKPILLQKLKDIMVEFQK